MKVVFSRVFFILVSCVRLLYSAVIKEKAMIFQRAKLEQGMDKKKSDMTAEIHYMGGYNGMLPAMFDVQPVPGKNKIHQ